MKKLYTLLTALCISCSIYAQAPEFMSYQAIVRDANDALIQNGNVGLRISILQGSETGSAVYTETHVATTNDNGLVTLDIGSGNTSDDFSSIDWSSGSYFIKSETDPNGGTNYTIEGTSQLLSVPYALFAKNAQGSSNNPSGSQTISFNDVDGQGEISVVYTNTEAYAFYRTDTGSGFWNSTSINGTPVGAVATNDIVVLYTDTEAYAFYRSGNGSGFWDSTSLNGAPINAIAANDIVVVYTNSEAYAFYRSGNGSGFWNSTSLNGTPIGVKATNEIVAVYNNTEAYAFYRSGNGSGFWNSTSLNGAPVGVGSTSESITIFSNTEAYAFYRSGNGSGFWNSTSLNGTPIGIIGSN